MHIPALEDLARGLKGVTITAGPAKDAEKKGLPVRTFEGVAIVPVMGVLSKRWDFFTDLFGGSSMLAIKAALQAVVKDPGIKEIMLKVDSPGGTVDGLEDLADTVAALARRKPITAFVDGLAASAGYYIASQANEVYANRGARVGSIGTISVLHDVSELAEKEGVKVIVVSTGKFKGAGYPGTKITAEQIAEEQKMVDYFGGMFVEAVSRGRKMEVELGKGVADGRIWPAPEALKLGLVDEVRSFDDVMSMLVGRVREARRRATATRERRQGARRRA
jgi:signal peptide peptidase SppA